MEDRAEYSSAIRSAFRFLEADYGMTLVGELSVDDDRLVVVVYANAFVQVECAATEGYFHAEIRRILDGVPASYDDWRNSIGFESLARLDQREAYDHWQYFAGGAGDVSTVLARTSDLFRRNRSIFTTSHWIDVDELQRLKDADFQRTFGEIPDRPRRNLLDLFIEKASPVLRRANFELVHDSRRLAPWDKDRACSRVVFAKGDQRVRLSQRDWRDAYFLYDLTVGARLIATVDLESGFERCVDTLVRELIEEMPRLPGDCEASPTEMP